MTTLECNATHCTYNDERKCSKGDISVGGKDACESRETCCESFVKAGSGTQNSCGCGHARPKADISCDAKNCVHNRDCKCQAECVGINGGNAETVQQTECSEFCCK